MSNSLPPPWTVACQAPLSVGILQARILEYCQEYWRVAMPSSRGSSPPRDQICISYVLLHWQAGSLPPAPSGKPICELVQAIEIRRAGCQTGGDSGKIWYCSLGAEFFLWKPILLLKPSTDWMRSTHIIEGNLYLKSTNYIFNIHIYKIPSQQHWDQCLIELLGTIT